MYPIVTSALKEILNKVVSVRINPDQRSKMGSCICSCIHGDDDVATKPHYKMEIIGSELIIHGKRHQLQNLVAVSFEGKILRFRDSRDQTTYEYLLPTAGHAEGAMAYILKSIIDSGTELETASDLSKVDYTVLNFVHRTQQ